MTVYSRIIHPSVYCMYIRMKYTDVHAVYTCSSGYFVELKFCSVADGIMYMSARQLPVLFVFGHIMI